MTERTRLIVRVVMTEYMILMAGALLLYLAELIWPHDLVYIGWIGGLVLAILCVINISALLKPEASEARIALPNEDR